MSCCPVTACAANRSVVALGVEDSIAQGAPEVFARDCLLSLVYRVVLNSGGSVAKPK